MIESQKDGTFYKGFTENPARRLAQHNAAETKSTRHLIPWILVFVEELPSKKEALIREKNLKKATRERLQALIHSPKNIAGQFGSPAG